MRSKQSIKTIAASVFSECDSLEKIVFRKKVDRVEDMAFQDNKSLKVTEFKKRVPYLSSGAFNTSKKIIVKKLQDIPSTLFSNGRNVGTKLLTEVNDKLNYKKLFKKAYKKVGTKFPSSKQISSASARRLAKIYNGPLFYMIFPPKCNYSKYSRKYAKKIKSTDAGLRTEYLGEMAYDYPNTVYTPKKARKIVKKKAPIVYCLAEMTGYSGPKVYKAINSSKNITRKYYYLTFRFSFWNAKSGKLVAWFNYQGGWAPITYKLSEEYKITRTVDGLGDKRVFLEKDGTSPDCLGYVERLLYGRKKRTFYN